MIERLYIHNYKGFVNFEMKCGPFVFLMGRNGSGKSSILEVLENLAWIITGEGSVQDLFPATARCRFASFPAQVFELSVRLGEDLFRYKLEIEHRGPAEKPAVRLEELTADSVRLFAAEDGMLKLHNDRGEEKAAFPYKSSEGGLGVVEPRKENQRLSRFKSWAASFFRLQLDPWGMSSKGRRTNDKLDPRGYNFSTWLDMVTRADTEKMLDYFKLLGEVLPGFKSINWRPLDRTNMALEAVFDRGASRGKFELDELSEGQKCLIALYAVLHFGISPGSCVVFDEPDNFLALSEIEPFLHELESRIENLGAQAFLVSHHPEFYNRLAADSERSRYLERRDGLFRLVEVEWDGSLKPAELVARGWEGA